MAFLPWKQWAEQDTESYIIANSQTLGIGDPVMFGTTAGTGFLQSATQTNSSVYGVVVGFKASAGGSSQGSLTGTSVAAASNNQTVDLYRAVVLPARQSRLFIADLNQTAGTTTGSGDPGQFSFLSTVRNQLSEATYVVQAPVGGKLTFFSIGSGLSTSSNGPTGLFPLTDHQVLGFFTNNVTP